MIKNTIKCWTSINQSCWLILSIVKFFVHRASSHAVLLIHVSVMIWTFDAPHSVCVTSSSISKDCYFLLCLLPLMFLSPLPDTFCNLDIPVIDMELESILDLAHISPFRNLVTLLESTNSRADSEEESESTVLWRRRVPALQMKHWTSAAQAPSSVFSSPAGSL